MNRAARTSVDDFDEEKCNVQSFRSQRFFAIFIAWTSEISDLVEEHLIFFGVSEDIDEHTEFEDIDDDLKKFGFIVADWFDIICLALNEVFGDT